MSGDVEDLYERMRDDPQFDDLRRGKNPLVPGEGQQPSGVFIVGEAPGADEVMALRPFVGASGRVLRQLMATANLRAGNVVFPNGEQFSAQSNCWLTNAVKYRPPRNRTPTLPEIMAARPYLLTEWALTGQAPVVITVGSVALTAITGKQISISKVVGKPVKSRHGRTLWPMFHPAFGLRATQHVRDMIESHWNDLAGWLENENRS